MSYYQSFTFLITAISIVANCNFIPCISAITKNHNLQITSVPLNVAVTEQVRKIFGLGLLRRFAKEFI